MQPNWPHHAYVMTNFRFDRSRCMLTGSLGAHRSGGSLFVPSDKEAKQINASINAVARTLSIIYCIRGES